MNKEPTTIENHAATTGAPPAKNEAAGVKKSGLARNLILFVVLLAGGFCLWRVISGSNHPGAQSGDNTATVAVAKATRGDLAQYSILTAEFVPYQDVSVHAKVAGYVKSITVDIGDHVKTGQVMAVLEIPELNDDLNKANAELQTSKAEVGQAKADYDDADLIYKRLTGVAKANPKLVAQQDLDNAMAKDSEAASALDSAQKKVDENQANVEKMNALLAYSSIPAPFDGVITHRYSDTGALVQAGTSSETQAMPVVDVAEDDVLRLIFPVPESAVPAIHEGLPVQISVKALNQTFQGTITRYADKVDMSTRTMRTEVDVPNPDGKFTPGMYADVKLPIAERKNVVTVPLQALSTAEVPTVLVLGDDGKLEERKVTVGLETSSRAEIISGVKENELVVTGSRANLHAGDKATGKLVETPTPE